MSGLASESEEEVPQATPRGSGHCVTASSSSTIGRAHQDCFFFIYPGGPAPSVFGSLQRALCSLHRHTSTLAHKLYPSLLTLEDPHRVNLTSICSLLHNQRLVLLAGTLLSHFVPYLPASITLHPVPNLSPLPLPISQFQFLLSIYQLFFFSSRTIRSFRIQTTGN